MMGSLEMLARVTKAKNHEDPKFKVMVILSYIMSLRPAWDTYVPISKENDGTTLKLKQ